MLRSLQTSREQQRQLIADAGHELRTPLTSMRTNIELLLADDTSGMLPEGARSVILGDVAAQLGEFSALVGDLVALTRDDHLQRPHEPLDMAEVTESAIERARRRGPNITFDVTLEPTPVMGDPSTLERAITNLLDNAVKFSPSYGTIVVTLEDGTLTVVDEGPGIADEDLPADLRPLLPLGPGAQHPRHRAGAFHRGSHGAGARRVGARGQRPGPRGEVRAAAAGDRRVRGTVCPVRSVE